MSPAYLIGSAGFVLIWLALWFPAGTMRRTVMLQVSAITAVTGLLEPLFKYVYWDPPSLFDLNKHIGFDIESVVFSFAAGGIVAAIYTALVATRGTTLIERPSSRRFHLYTLLVPIPVFAVVVMATKVNPIYSAIVALLAGAVAICVLQPALTPKILLAGFLFTGLYLACFVVFTTAFPQYLLQVWNLRALSGVMFAGVPVEELLFAFSYGAMYSSVAEYFFAKIASKAS